MVLNKIKNKVLTNRFLFTLSIWVWVIGLGGWVPLSHAESQDYIDIHLNKNRISADVEHASLIEVLLKLSQVFPVNITFKGIPPQRKINLNFKNLQIQDGIEQILEGESYVIMKLDSSNENNRFLKENRFKIVVHSSETNSYSCSPAENLFQNNLDPSLIELKCYILRGPDVQVRLSALEELLDRAEEEEVRKILVQMSIDSNPQIKEFAQKFLDQINELN